MNYFDLIIFNIIIIALPLMSYLLYVAYQNTYNKEEDNLIFLVIIISELYFISKYSIPLYKTVPLFIINFPLLFSYARKQKLSIIISSIIIILYYNAFYHNPIIILEYLIYYVLYLNIKKTNLFFLTFAIIKTILIMYLNNYRNIEVLIEGMCLYLISTFIICIVAKNEEMLKLHMSIKQIEREKQIKTSLFKITHEIKNPLAVCKGYLDMYNPKDIKNFQRHIPILQEEINRTLVLLEDFLTINKPKLQKDIIDINFLLEEIIKTTRALFEKNDIEFNYDISEDEVFIDGDYNRLTQVFVNIFKNSLEALENKENGQVTIWTKQLKDNIKIFIKDNGCGIPKNVLDSIKTPFYTTKYKGSGLGVSLSDEIIKAHKGKLEYSSKENEYTIVTLTLPIKKAI